MNQVYRFDDFQPPPLNEKTLQAKLDRRKLRRQTFILALSGMLVNGCLLLLAFILYPEHVFLSIACMAYVYVALCGGGAVAAVYSNKKGRILT